MLAIALILLHFAAAASGGILRTNNVNPLTSCSSIFAYQTRADDGRKQGVISIAQPLAAMLTDGRMLLDVSLLADGIVSKDLFRLGLFVNRTATIQNIRARRPLRYVLDFPMQSTVPVVIRIVFNLRILCEPMVRTFGSVTAIELHHMLLTGLDRRPSSLGYDDGDDYVKPAMDPLPQSPEQSPLGTLTMQSNTVDFRPYEHDDQLDDGYNYRDISDDNIDDNDDDVVGVGDYIDQQQEDVVGVEVPAGSRPETWPRALRTSAAAHSAHDDDGALRRPSPQMLSQPPQCDNQTFCDHVADYPSDFVESLIGADIEHGYDERLYTEPDVELVSRFGDDGHLVEADTTSVWSLCHASQQLIWPKTGLVMDNSWVFIVNSDRLKQGVLVETCINAGSRCEYARFQRNIRSGCHQKYGYRKMLTFRDVNSKPETTNIKLPIGCECQVWVV